ncbi:MAG: uncharacterized protein K0Q68_2161 [Moraxellaceae bacterium]|jgi:hypothetical protein|nr:uncharacterized protein [Moraxellaceae bacterium]
MDMIFPALDEAPYRPLRRMLRSTQPPVVLRETLQRCILGDLADGLQVVTGHDESVVREFLARLGREFIHVRQEAGCRIVSLCGGTTELHVKTQAVRDAEPASHFNDEAAIAVWEWAQGPRRHTRQWQVFSLSQWQIMILKWLRQRLLEWFALTGLSGEAATVAARDVAQAAIQRTSACGPLLDVVLLDALGYPRSLVDYHLRLCLKGRQPTSTEWEMHLLAHWSDRLHWPGRSRKLFPVAVAAAAISEAAELTPAQVRDALGAAGLSRNAWAHLARWPADTLQILCQTLEGYHETCGKHLFLQELSVWLARLGKDFRYYGIHRDCRLIALVWVVRESVEVRARAEVVERPVRMNQVSLVPECVFWHESLISRRDLAIHHHARLQRVLLAFAREVLLARSDLRTLFERLSEVLDWFCVEGLRIPRDWFKQPFGVMHGRSRCWHEEVGQFLRPPIEDDDDAPLAAGIAAPDGEPAPFLAWDVPLPCYEAGDLSFQALQDSQSLQEEGALMLHCVGTYAQVCAAGRSLIFAVSEAGQRLGTLEMGRDLQERWRPIQFKGLQNRQLLPTILPGGQRHLGFEAFRRALSLTAR